jgi:hypothetical protein
MRRQAMSAGLVLKFPKPGRLGDCPKCGRNDGSLNVYKAHWFICRRHRVKWYAGYDLFPGWQNETEEDWKRNLKILSQYQEVRAKYRKLRTTGEDE